MKTLSRSTLAAALAALVLTAGCRAKNAGPETGAHEEEAHAGEAAAAPPSITLSAAAVAAADIKTQAAVVRSVARRLAVPGELEWNPRRVAHLTARTAGRLERVLAVRGDRVRGGQLLAELYSPDYLTLQAEIIQAAARVSRHAGNPSEEGSAKAFLAGARDRLSLLGAPVEEIEALSAAAIPRPLLAVRAPFAGTVIEGGVVPGDAVELGTSLFRLADPSTLWACLHIREKDLGAILTDVEVALRTQAYPGEEFRGRLVLVGDDVDEATRTVEGRVELANPGGRLKAGMYVEATVATGGDREALVVPEESVQDDEGRAIVFVQTAERTFVRRKVRTGERFGGVVEILEGLAAGETVVTSGSFLLKSEVRKGTLEDEHGHD